MRKIPPGTAELSHATSCTWSEEGAILEMFLGDSWNAKTLSQDAFRMVDFSNIEAFIGKFALDVFLSSAKLSPVLVHLSRNYLLQIFRSLITHILHSY